MVDSKKFTFQKISQGMPFDKNTGNAREWFRNTALNIKSMSVPEFQRNATPFQKIAVDVMQNNNNNVKEGMTPNSIGKMYCFTYDPKWKEKLPYYDTFPLIFPIGFQSDRMHGINMHYLAPSLRAKLMNALYTTITNDKYNKTTKLKINYEILNSAVQFKNFKPCYKTYLFSHIRSPFININPEAWDYTLFLPLARFQKRSQDYVWLESSLSI
jgi:hypothetical protein